MALFGVRLSFQLPGDGVIGDVAWKEGLFHRYTQHVADSARHEREPQPFDRWATEATFVDFVRIARLTRALPPFALSDWETENPVPGSSGKSFRSRDLARRLISALVLVSATLAALCKHNRRASYAVKRYLDKGKVENGYERPLAYGKRWIYGRLVEMTERP